MTSAASLEFVPARRPEAVRMDVSKYKLIKPPGNPLSKRIQSKHNCNEGSDSGKSSSDESNFEESGAEDGDSLQDTSDSMEDSERSDTEESSSDEEERVLQPVSVGEGKKEENDEDRHALGNDKGDGRKLFYDINENPNDRGTRASKRIHKSWHPSARAPVGLVNGGVTCYMNAAIQALLHLPAMGRYLLEVLHGSHPKVSRGSVTYDLANLFKKMMEKKSPVMPSKLLHRLDDINPMLDEWQQEDSHEFYMSLVSRLQEDSVPKGEKLRSSIMHDIFGGSVEQKVTCQNCNTVSTTTQDFYDLPVSFSSHEENTEYTLESSIKDFFTPEAIALSEIGSGYQCETCKKRTNAVKQLAIAEAPEYLTVHIKRFKMDEGISKKVKETMTYPKEINLTQFETDSQDPLQYKLIAVIVHEGRTVSSGHYIALTLQPNNTWMMYDDDLMREIPTSSAESHPSAYILLYSRLLKKPEKLNSKQNKANGHQTQNPAPLRLTSSGPITGKHENSKKSQKAAKSSSKPKKASRSPNKSMDAKPKLLVPLSKRKGSTESIDDIFGKSKKLKKRHR